MIPESPLIPETVSGSKGARESGKSGISLDTGHSGRPLEAHIYRRPAVMRFSAIMALGRFRTFRFSIRTPLEISCAKVKNVPILRSAAISFD